MNFRFKILACLVHCGYGAIAFLIATEGLFGGALRKTGAPELNMGKDSTRGDQIKKAATSVLQMTA
jgi:hypothetical protein